MNRHVRTNTLLNFLQHATKYSHIQTSTWHARPFASTFQEPACGCIGQYRLIMTKMNQKTHVNTNFPFSSCFIFISLCFSYIRLTSSSFGLVHCMNHTCRNIMNASFLHHVGKKRYSQHVFVSNTFIYFKMQEIHLFTVHLMTLSAADCTISKRSMIVDNELYRVRKKQSCWD